MLKPATEPLSGRGASLRRLLAHPRLPLALAALAMLLCAPALTVGLHSDDYIIRLMLTDPPPGPEWSRPFWRAFAFLDSETTLRHWLSVGGVPWWTDGNLRLSFFRPLSGLTHWLDFRLWPERVALMHVQSLVWFGAMVIAAAALYRRLLGAGWIAGLAALAFALDDAHSSPILWLANRNAIIASFFCVLALVAYDRWRRDAWRPGRILAPAAFLLGLLGGEIALAGGAYLLAYALFLDEAPWRERLLALLPSGLVGCAWLLAYRVLGFGAGGSGVYIDPLADTAGFAQALVERAPLLLFGQWALPSHMPLLLSRPAAEVFWRVACVAAVLILALLLPLLRADRTARFFALGMLLSLLPAASSFPHDRLLFMAGVGGTGLLAQVLGGLVTRAAWLPRTFAWRVPAYALGVLLGVLHLVLSPLALARAAGPLHAFGEMSRRSAVSLPNQPDIRQRTAVVVQAPTGFVATYTAAVRHAAGLPAPRRLLVLGAGVYSMEVTRVGDDTLVVRPEGGYLLPRGDAPQDRAQPPVDARYLVALFDNLYRGSTPFTLGQRVELPDATVEVTSLTPDGRPAEARFRFARGLHDPSLLWLRWDDGVYVPFELPAAGASVTLPPAQVRLW